MKAFSYLLVASILFSACQKKSDNVQSAPQVVNMERIASRLIAQSSLQPGERVLLMGKPGEFDSLASLLGLKIQEAGAVYLGALAMDTTQSPESWKTEFTMGAQGKSKEELITLFDNVDLGIMLPGANPTHLQYSAMQEVLRKGKGRTIHFHWLGAYDFSSSAIPVDSTISRFYQTALEETDYKQLAAVQNTFEEQLRKSGATVTTPEGTNLSFLIGDRPVTKQNGDASLAHMNVARNLIDREVELPAGAIRVAPIEESVNGTIAFPDAVWNDHAVTGLMLTIAKGKVIDIKATLGAEHVKAELDPAGDAGYSFREVAIGFNPLLAIPSDKPWIPYYGYGAGVVRLSLGDNSELGGKVTGGYVRWNFFTNATVKVGEELWVDRGKLMK